MEMPLFDCSFKFFKGANNYDKGFMMTISLFYFIKG